MASSISSSDAPPPSLPWRNIFGVALSILVAYILISETLLAEKGFIPTVQDSEARWIKERKRASELGERALILIGASRIQLGIDLNTLRKTTRLEPVQLAIDGSSYVPVLQGLARDPRIRGTVIIDLMPGPVSFQIGSTGISQNYQAKFDSLSSAGFEWPTYQNLDARLAETIRQRLVNYADGARPLDSLANRITNPKAMPQYLLSLPDRSRLADYQRVSMPDFYLSRVLRHLGNPPEFDISQPQTALMDQLSRHIGELQPESASGQPAQGMNDLETSISAIQSRGGRVIILQMPTSGLILEADSRRFPRALYWDRVVASTTATTIHWQDHPDLSGFFCPDGSHLDKRDTKAFTEKLVAVAGLSRR